MIAYGGDHAVQVASKPYAGNLPDRYGFALCRIEPENNVAMILEAFSRQTAMPLVFVGNWDNSAYGKGLLPRTERPGISPARISLRGWRHLRAPRRRRKTGPPCWGWPGNGTPGT